MRSLMDTEISGVVGSWLPNPKPRPGPRKSSWARKQCRECVRTGYLYKFELSFFLYFFGGLY